MSNELSLLDATAQAELVRSGEVTPLELVEAAIERIERVDPQLNAVVHRRFEKALEEAKGPLPDGPFRGVPFMVKDLWSSTAGDPMHNGVRAMKEANYIAPDDTWLIARYRRAGFVIVGRTATPELGLVATTEAEINGPTKNPWNTAFTPAGSSGGSAAAVASGMVPIAHATDGGGSIRIPASACGLVGLKVSQGRITMGPGRFESGLGVEHCVSRSVRDSAAVLDATHGPGAGDQIIAPPPSRPYLEEIEAEPQRLRIGFTTMTRFGAADPGCIIATTEAAELLDALGHHVEPNNPAVLEELGEVGRHFGVLWAMQARQNLDLMGRLLNRELVEGDVEAMTWAMVKQSEQLGPYDFAKSLALLATFRRSMAKWWAPTDGSWGIDGQGFDLLLTPTTSITTPMLGDLVPHPDHPERLLANARMSAFTSMANVTGQPAISIPLEVGLNGLPQGVQLIAAYGREDLLLRTARQLEQASPWAQRRPLVHA
jgi:amidase